MLAGAVSARREAAAVRSTVRNIGRNNRAPADCAIHFVGRSTGVRSIRAVADHHDLRIRLRRHRQAGENVRGIHRRVGAGGCVSFVAAGTQHRDDDLVADPFALEGNDLIRFDREDRAIAIEQRQDYRLGNTRFRQRDNLLDRYRRRIDGYAEHRDQNENADGCAHRAHTAQKCNGSANRNAPKH